MRKDKERTATVETSKVKEERPAVAGRCWKAVWLGALQKTGELFISSPQKVLKRKLFFSETWVLPFSTLLAMVVYAIVAITFYTRDD